MLFFEIIYPLLIKIYILNITFLLNIFNTYSLISFIIDDTILNVRSSYYEFQLGRLFGCNDLERFLSPYRQFLN